MRGGEFKPGPGVDSPPPATGFRRFFFVFGNHFGKLVLANILFVLLSVPVVTMPAALCGLNSVCSQLMRTGMCYTMQDFMDGFRHRFVAKTLLGLPFCVVVGGTVLMYVAGMRTLPFYIAVAVACYFFIAACYFFPYVITDIKETPPRVFLRAFYSRIFSVSTLRLLPVLAPAVLFTLLNIAILPIMFIIGMSLIVALAQAAVY